MSGRNDQKIADLGDKRRFCDCGLFAQSAAMFTHSALRLLSLQTWRQQGMVSESVGYNTGHNVCFDLIFEFNDCYQSVGKINIHRG